MRESSQDDYSEIHNHWIFYILETTRFRLLNEQACSVHFRIVKKAGQRFFWKAYKPSSTKSLFSRMRSESTAKTLNSYGSHVS